MDAPTSDDLRYLDRAAALGRKGWEGAHPNPMVGCLLVREGEVVGEGYHEKFGEPHAEVNALRAAGERARGATAYVSLEPCNHHGKTPPCTEALVEAGVRRVVFGAPDPGAVSSGGAEALEQAGLEVVGPVFSPSRSRTENPAFFYNTEHEAPYMAVKLAQTLDGRIAAAPGTRTLITGPEAQAETHRLRAGFDAIMVGAETAVVDDPRLTVRPGSTPEGEEAPAARRAVRPPFRIVLDSRARLSPSARLFEEDAGGPVMVFTGQADPAGNEEALRKRGARVVKVPEGPGGVSLEAVLDECWRVGIRSIFCEGGGRLAMNLLREGRVQRLFLFVAPFVLGEAGVPGFPGIAGTGLEDALRPAAPPALFGRDVLLTYDGMI